MDIMDYNPPIPQKRCFAVFTAKNMEDEQMPRINPINLQTASHEVHAAVESHLNQVFNDALQVEPEP